MYCSKCGKELPENSAFCNACGTAVGVAPKKQEISILSKLSGSRIAILASNALILWLCFKEWIVIDTSITYSKFTTLKFTEYVEKIADWGIGELGALQVGSAAVLILNIVMILITGVFVVKDVLNNENKINWGYGVAEGAAAIAVTTAIVSFFTRKHGFGITSNLYIILALAIANRFLILPKYESDEYRRVLEEQKEERAKKEEGPRPEKVTYKDDRWRCLGCGEENERSAMTCKNCGRYK